MDTPSSDSTFPSEKDMGEIGFDLLCELDNAPSTDEKISILSRKFGFADTAVDKKFEDIGYLIFQKGEYTGIFNLHLNIFVKLPIIPGGNPFFGKISTYGAIFGQKRRVLYVAIDGKDNKYPILYAGVIMNGSLREVETGSLRLSQHKLLTVWAVSETLTSGNRH